MTADRLLRRIPADTPRDQTLVFVTGCAAPDVIRESAHLLSPSSFVIGLHLESPVSSLRRGFGWCWLAGDDRSERDRGQIAAALDETLRNAIRIHAVRRIVAVRAGVAPPPLEARYRTMIDAMRTDLATVWRNRAAEIRLGRRWAGNLLVNARHPSLSPADLWAEVCRGEGVHHPDAAVLVGAGPSLAVALPYLRSVRETGGVPIVALDTALGTLAAAGLVPDAVVAMDGQIHNARDLVPFRWSGVPLFADVTAHPSIMRAMHAGGSPCSLFVSGDPLASSTADKPELLAHLPRLPGRGSVAPSAVELLVDACGVRRLGLVGIDFGYRASATHAPMAPAHRRFLRVTARVTIPDGDPATLRRPRRAAPGRQGRSVDADAVLADQALQFAALARSVAGRATLRVISGHSGSEVPDAALDVGVPALDASRATPWLTEGTDELGAPGAPGALAAPEVQPGTPPRQPPPPARWASPHGSEPPFRAAPPHAIVALTARLRAQERVLASDAPLFLDQELSFAWLDLPQWPLLALRQEWAQMHRARLLRAVRDTRRRAERASRRGRP